MAVLVCLAQQAGNVVSREQLEAEVWSGRIVGYDSLSNAIIKLRKAFGDSSRQPEIIETIPKKGYRLIAEVKPVNSTQSTASPVQHSLPPVKPQTSTEQTPGNPYRNTPRIAVFLALVTLVIATTTFIIQRGDKTDHSAGSRATLSRIPVIAVLPFNNMSSDPEQNYLGDSISANLITGLSKISSLSVLAQQSTLSYRGTNIDIRIIGKTLGARYVLEGDIRRSSTNVRISARFIDAETGFNLWADYFDGPLENVFSFQDKVTSSIISSLQIKLTANENLKQSYTYTSNIKAYSNFLYGWQQLWSFTRNDNKSSREYFLKAIELDPNFARAYADLAISYVFDFSHRWSNTSEQSLQLALDSADRAIGLKPGLPHAYLAKGYAELYAKEHEHAILMMQKGISLDPEYANAYALLAMALNFSDQPEDAQKIIETATSMQLNPRHDSIFKYVSGQIAFNLAHYDDAIKILEQALQLNPTSSRARVWLAAAYAHTGNIEDASWELAEAASMEDTPLSIELIDQVVPFKNTKKKQHLLDGLRKAGLKD